MTTVDLILKQPFLVSVLCRNDASVEAVQSVFAECYDALTTVLERRKDAIAAWSLGEPLQYGSWSDPLEGTPYDPSQTRNRVRMGDGSEWEGDRDNGHPVTVQYSNENDAASAPGCPGPVVPVA